MYDSVPASPCQNGGTCTQTTDGVTLAPDSYHCVCAGGWEGTDCDQDVDECAANGGFGSCVNGAVCSESSTDGTIPINEYECACPQGWEGPNCDQDVDDCAPGWNLVGDITYTNVLGYPCVSQSAYDYSCMHGKTVAMSQDGTRMALSSSNAYDSNQDQLGYVAVLENIGGTWTLMGDVIWGPVDTLSLIHI